LIDKLVPTICPYCAVGCGFYLSISDGCINGIEYQEEHPVNQGSLCPKGNAACEIIYRSDRLTKPLKKTKDGFIEISWEEALSKITEELNTHRKADPDSIMILSSAKCTNEENYLIQKFARAVIRTNNIDHCARLCHASTVAGLVKTFGSGAMTNSIPDIEESKCIFIIGANPHEQHPVLARRILRAKDKGATLIVADPRNTPTAWSADFHLQHLPGSDVALINAMMNVIISEGLTDDEFITKRTGGYEKLKRVVEKYTPEKVEKIVGVSSGKIREAARAYGQAETATIIYSMGITQHTTGTDNVASLANLAMITGNLGKPGSGVNPLRGQNNVQGACDLGALSNVYPSYQSVTDQMIRKKFEKEWKVKALPDKVGLTVVEAFNAVLKGKLKAMYIVGENPVISDPDTIHVRQALEALDFLVVQDIFLTETAEYADIILPSSCWAEKSGTFTGTDRRIQFFPKAIDPPGEAKEDWTIVCEIAKRLGNAEQFSFSSVEEIFEEIRKVTPIYAGITSEKATRIGGVQWPCPSIDHPGTQIMYTEKFNKPDGKGQLQPVEYKEPNEMPDDNYPFFLTTGRVVYHCNSGSMTRRSKSLMRESPESWVEISPEDSLKLGISDGQLAVVSTRRGEIMVKVKVTRLIRPGVIFIPFHFAEPSANILTNPALDPEAKIPEYKVAAAAIGRVE
jgi:formate dehydrogenase major subunit